MLPKHGKSFDPLTSVGKLTWNNGMTLSVESSMSVYYNRLCLWHIYVYHWCSFITSSKSISAFDFLGPDYYASGFLTIQHALQTSIIKALKPDVNVSAINVQIERFPLPPYTSNPLIETLNTFSLFFNISLILFALFITKEVTKEKEQKLKVGWN